jgi:hypothetical protein
MTMIPDFKAAAYNISCVLNGLQHQWCDGEEPDARCFNSSVVALRESALLPYLRDVNPPLARALDHAFYAVQYGKETATELFSDALRRVVRDVPQIAAHTVDFNAYCNGLGKNKAAVYGRGVWRDPNLRAA